jgi:hypothetical protein
MLVLIINMQNLTRIHNLEAAWGRDFRRLSPSSVYTIGTPEPVDNLPVHIISNRHETRGAIQDLLFTFEDHLENFLANTTLPWFIRTTEDAFVHLKRLPQMLIDLNSNFNPLSDFVFKGQSIFLHPNVIFVHGGSGWIMSRAACQFYRERMAEINAAFFAEAWGDDLMPSTLLQMRNGTWEDFEHAGWVGSPLSDESSKRITRGNYDGLPICADRDWQMRKKRLGRFLRDVVVWHSGRNDIVTVVHGYKAAAEAGANVFLGHIRSGVMFCEWNPEKAAEWVTWWVGK